MCPVYECVSVCVSVCVCQCVCEHVSVLQVVSASRHVYDTLYQSAERQAQSFQYLRLSLSRSPASSFSLSLLYLPAWLPLCLACLLFKAMTRLKIKQNIEPNSGLSAGIAHALLRGYSTLFHCSISSFISHLRNVSGSSLSSSFIGNLLTCKER